VILVDLGLRNLNGLNIAKTLSREFPGLTVIGMGLVPTQSDIVEFVEAGASGFILKDASVKGFLGTIRTVARGGKVLPTTLAGSLFIHVIDQAFKRGRIRPASAVRMTKSERGIVALIADGLTTRRSPKNSTSRHIR
jgi:DNA-binding NarL/FixJ family response regulator